MRKYVISIVFLYLCSGVFGQIIKPDTIKLSGIVLDADSLNAMSNVHITSQKRKGFVTDEYGQFSFKINTLDTLTFTYMGYKPYTFIIPDTLKIYNYMAGVILNKDTISLSEVIILPWMNKRQFKQSFAENTPDQNTVNAKRNLNLAGHTARTTAPKWTSDAIVDYQLKQYAMDVEYKGMVSANQQLNIIGLAQLLIYYSHKKLTKEEKTQKIKEELRKHIETEYPR